VLVDTWIVEVAWAKDFSEKESGNKTIKNKRIKKFFTGIRIIADIRR
jgi:hypothetical protein